MPTENHELYIHRCLQLAANGLGYVSPNPLVGCVIVDDSGNIISEGFHQRYGCNHAERNAILNICPHLADNQIYDPCLAGCTLYVNLEPCSHYGKTPPCADLIVRSGISKVVCCNDDPNPQVSGRGYEKLQQNGIEVIRHVLEHEGRQLNRRFFTYIEQQRPYIILKWAESADRYMAPASITTPNISTKKQYWISDARQSYLSHLWRTQEAGILIGSETYIKDRPQLTPRHLHGNAPQPIVLDRRKRLNDVPPHWLHLHCTTLSEVMTELYNQKIQSVIVEGGRKILDDFLAEKLYDEIRVLRSPSLLGDGVPAPPIPPGAVLY